jgi:hypothetical protein
MLFHTYEASKPLLRVATGLEAWDQDHKQNFRDTYLLFGILFLKFHVTYFNFFKM